jgi:hypothetical protein
MLICHLKSWARHMDLMDQVHRRLRADEQLLWVGAPDAGVWFTSEDVDLIPFSILWCGFMIVIGWQAPFPFRLWFILLVVIGLYFVAGRFFYKNYRKRSTMYAVTTKRAMMLRPRSFVDLPLKNQPADVRWSRNGRHASVTFLSTLPPEPPLWVRRGVVPGPNTGMDLHFGNTSRPFAFYDVANPDTMIDALIQARTGAYEASEPQDDGDDATETDENAS